jgi:beta-glucosidase
MGWPVTPDALRWLPRFVHERYAKPIQITENGLANLDWIGHDGRVRDTQRIEFLDSYIGALSQGISDGADVRAYYQWSLLDNFEWALGYDRRFGLIHVDFATQKRTLKDSALWYKAVIESNGSTVSRARPQAHAQTKPVSPSKA